MKKGFDYTPPDSLADFFLSDKRVRFTRGPIGSSKSTAMVMELFRRACEQKPDADGLRRTRFAIIRNTLQQIRETCLQTVYTCIRPLVFYKVSEQKVYLEFNDVRSEWLLLPLDTPENINKLLSLELTGGWISEAREIEPEILMNVLSRCGRYPSRINGGCSWYGVIAESNSFSEDSPWYDQLELNLPENWGYFIQPGARDPEADWLQYLPPDYYEDLIQSNPESWIEQYVDNQIGPSLSGQAVFARSFDRGFHTTETLYPDYTRPLVVGLDTGRNPAAVVGQIDSRGRMLVFSSVWAENQGMEQFLTTKVRPHLNEKFKGGKFFVAVDPAARQRSQIGEESVYEAIRRLGFSVILAPTNQIAPRLRAVERYMSLQIGGGPGFIIDQSWNDDLLRALLHDYRYKRMKNKTLHEIPEKGHPESDLADALQYLCLSAGSSAVARELSQPMKVQVKPKAAGWT